MTIYADQVAAFGRQVQWLVEIDVDRCTRTYTQAPCTAADAGDGSRCWYSYTTCQDPANYDKGTRTLRFCLNEVPWPDSANPAHPLLEKFVAIPQKIEMDRLTTIPEKLTVRFLLDYAPHPPDIDKGSGYYNTTTYGEFWNNLLARSPNLMGRPMRLYRGFNASGFGVSDFVKLGPTYLISGVKFDAKTVTIEGLSELAKLDKAVVPWAVSDDNTLRSSITSGSASIDVLDTSEFPDPADYTRNDIYIKIDNEILQVTAITDGNTLAVARARCGTTAASHAADAAVTHVALFGTDNGSGTPTARGVVDIILDLLEWAGVAAGDIDTAAFTDAAYDWPRNDCYALLEKSDTIASYLQQIKRTRGILIYLDSSGKWTCTTCTPDTPAATLTDDNLVEGKTVVEVDDDQRITRCSFWYDPSTEQSRGSAEYLRGVIVIDAVLEGANEYNDVRDAVFEDAWIDPSEPPSNIRNIARHIITRLRRGLRTITFQLELKDSALWPGDRVSITTRKIVATSGQADTRNCVITARREVSAHVTEYEAVDLEFAGRFLRIAPDTATDDYDTATTDEKLAGYYWGDSNNRVGTLLEPGSIFW